jgi:cell wall-associated NlpC family hydrolase
MRRTFAFVIGLALLAATPGLATADPYARPAAHQQAIDYVISRALSQRGVPFSYGGGDANGPTRGNPNVENGELQPVQSAVGLEQVPAGAGFGTAPSSIGFAPALKPVGFDASGLVLYAFAGVGIKMPRTSGDQYKVGQKIAPAQALPGDLIFYGPDGSQSVAIFVGNGQMVQGTEPAVTVSPVRTEGMAPYLTRIIS